MPKSARQRRDEEKSKRDANDANAQQGSQVGKDSSGYESPTSFGSEMGPTACEIPVMDGQDEREIQGKLV